MHARGPVAKFRRKENDLPPSEKMMSSKFSVQIFTCAPLRPASPLYQWVCLPDHICKSLINISYRIMTTF